MANSQLLDFVDDVVRRHELATGLKKLSSHLEYENNILMTPVL